MAKVIRFLGGILFIVLFLGIPSIATETITLTTYYPAPYGVFDELDVTGNVGIGTTGPVSALEMYGASGVTQTITSASAIADPTILFRTGVTPANRFRVGVDVSDSNKFKIAYNALLGTVNDFVTIDTSGRVGIGADPTAKLHVNGNIIANLTAGGTTNMKGILTGLQYEFGRDVAELFDASEEVEVGEILVIDETEGIQLRKSRTPYEKGAIGIVSGSPAILFEGSQLEIAPAPGGFTKGKKPPVALAGRVPCKVSLENGAIERGDFLTSSSTPGHAMKATDRDKSFGTIVGKALQPFNGGPEGEDTGMVLVLVTLQ